MDNYVLKARITYLPKVAKRFKSKANKDITLLTFYILDNSENELECNFFGILADEYCKKLEQG